jgi:hypothetical protein
MHHINREYWNPNSLSPGDVNGDGLEDYAVVHEMWDGYKSKFTLTLHPERGGDLRQLWKKVVIYESQDTAMLEYCDLADFDGDGKIDLVGVQGPESVPDVGVPSGVRLLWGPGPARVAEPGAWIDSGLMPQTVERGHHLYVKAFDINGDGAVDIVFGGRQHQRNKTNAGIGWIKAPSNSQDRRDLSKWTVHYIDPDTAGGHGFVFADIDQDGDMDLVDNSADWNTPNEDEKTRWYENPGLGTPEQKQRWTEHVIHRSPAYYSKAQVAVGDIDGDGLSDVVVQGGDKQHAGRLYLLRKLKQKPGPQDWQVIEIAKPAATNWLSRPIQLADVNGDDRLDIVGALIHDETGNLPADKAAIFWMEFTGDKPAADNWLTHVIKPSDGTNTGTNERGEKWDHLRLLDLDGDGDLDVVANVEEHQTADRNTLIGEAWFENPTR